MVLFRNMLDHMRFNEVIENCQSLLQPHSNRRYHVKTVIEAFMVSIWCGANRFMHKEITRHDNPISKIFIWQQAPGQDIYKRFFPNSIRQLIRRYLDSFTNGFLTI